MKIKAIIVDDECHNRENLQHLLHQYCPQIEILALCENAAEARRQIITFRPALLFLDIEMPNENGFDLLASLPSIPFEVIFVTAYDHYGIKAIKFSALDYLLKPLDSIELVKAVEKATRVIEQKQENDRINNLLLNSKREREARTIAITHSDQIEFVRVASIVRCESDSNYTTVFLQEGRKIIASKPLKEFDELLGPYRFLRVHQSHLINLNEIKSFVKKEGGYIALKDGSQIPVSRQRREMVLEALQRL